MRRDTSGLGNRLQPHGRNAVRSPIEQRPALDAQSAHESVLAPSSRNRRFNRFIMTHKPIMQISCTLGKRNQQAEFLHSILSQWVRQSDVTSNSHKRLVGDRLRIAIEALGKRPVDICRMFDVAQPKLGNWMRGDHYPDPWFIVRFCDRFNLSADYFYRGRVSSAMDCSLADALWAAEGAAQREQQAQAAPAPVAKK